MKKHYSKLPLLAMMAITMVLGGCEKDTPAEETKETFLASDQPTTASAVLEEYTGVRCTYCPDGHRRAQKLADENPGKVVLINVHVGNYATPSSGWPDFTTQWGDGLKSISNLGGYPAGSMNRFTFDGKEGTAPYWKQKDNSMAISRGGFTAAGLDRMSQPTNVNMGMKSEFNASTRELKVTVELYYTGDETIPNFLNVAVLENGVVGRQIDAGVDKPDYVHNHMLRTLITGQWGELVPTTTKGTRYKKTFTYIVPSTFVADNLEVAAFVTQQNANQKVPIINGISAKLK